MIFARQSLISHWREFGKSSVLVAVSGVLSAGLLEIFTQIIMATAQMMRLSAVMPMPIRRPIFNFSLGWLFLGGDRRSDRFGWL